VSTINTAILGAYAKASGEISLDYLEQAIRETVPAKIEANVTAALHAFDVTHVMEGVN